MDRRWLSIRKLLNYIGIKLSLKSKPERVRFLPVTLDIEPNNTCNLRCPHCQVTYWTKERSRLDTESFRKILGQFPGLVRVKLQGMGEPMLNSRLVEMLGEGEKRGIVMNVVTNGTVCRGETARGLLGLGRTEITFSLDGASAEVFERIRAGSSFEEVTENIRDLVRERGGGGWPRLTGWTVVTADNVDELEAITRLAADLGLDGLTIQTFLTDWGKTEMREHTGPVKVASVSPALERSLSAALAAARETGLEMTVASHDYYSEDNKCPWPWTSAFISASGDVVPCCIIADPDTVSMGNIFKQDFRSIWNSPAYMELRRRIRGGDLPGYCRNCYGLD